MSPAWLRALQVVLSAVAGFVDAIGFLSLGGIYVAFMSGNSTLLGMAAGNWSAGAWWLSAAAVGCFVAGVALGTLVGGLMRRRRPAGVLVLVGALLAVGAVLSHHGMAAAGGLVLAGAMGVENTVFNRPGCSGVGLTYMTGTLVRVGQHLAAAVSGGSWAAVVPDLLLWVGLLAGAALGVLVFGMIGTDGLWICVAVTLVLAGVSLLVMPALPAKP